MDFKSYLDMSQEVCEALRDGKPVVALESTIISHGFPYPQNRENALKCEEVIREEGAVPATIAIIGGRIKVGLDKDQLEYLSSAQGVAKCSRRDLAAIIALHKDGATTVAGTMAIAQSAGIKVFATGGIGGVHRFAQQTFDISADLEEFAQTDVAVVCAGVKSILDVGLTLEYLETAGVPIIGYGTDEFPCFYTRTSGFAVDYRMDQPETIAAMLRAKSDLKLRGGVLIANPIPQEHALEREYVDRCIEQALQEARAQNVKGKAVTPFLLDQMYHITAGRSIEANKALVQNNARVAARIAIALG